MILAGTWLVFRTGLKSLAEEAKDYDPTEEEETSTGGESLLNPSIFPYCKWTRTPWVYSYVNLCILFLHRNGFNFCIVPKINTVYIYSNLICSLFNHMLERYEQGFQWLWGKFGWATYATGVVHGLSLETWTGWKLRFTKEHPQPCAVYDYVQ